MNYKAIIFDLDGTLYDSKRLPLRLILGDLGGALTLRAERKARRALMGRDFGTEADFRRAFFADIAWRRGTSADSVADWYDNRYMPLMVAVLRMYYTARPCTEPLLAALREGDVRTIVYSDYGEVEAVSRALKAGDAVVLSLKRTDNQLSKRVLDFSFGVASALDASVDCIADQVFALTRGRTLADSELADLRAKGVV